MNLIRAMLAALFGWRMAVRAGRGGAVEIGGRQVRVGPPEMTLAIRIRRTR